MTISDNPLLLGSTGGFDNDYLGGSIDEARVSDVARSSDWIKLSYENQNAAQSLVSLPIIEGCVAEFGVVDDTLQAAEGGSFTAEGNASCALRYYWSMVDGGTETPVASDGLSVSASIGRISGDTAFTYRFHALFDTGWASTDVVVEVMENIPDPEFNLSSPFNAGEVWNGGDTIEIQPFVTNLSAILALDAPYNTINYVWTRSGVTISSVMNENIITLRRAYGDGTLNIQLCADNGGAVNCKAIDIEVLRPVGILDKENVPLIPIEMQGGLLKWNRHARIKVWSMEGRLIFNEAGQKGRKLELSPDIQRIFVRNQHLVKILPLD
jgi:hypothetical protein